MPLRRSTALLSVLAFLLAIAPMTTAGAVDASTDVWINEFHYDNVSTDQGEFIEVALAEGTDLSGWSIVRYNGANRVPYSSPAGPDEGVLGALTPTGAVDGFEFVVVEYPSNGIQNGSPDGFALIDDGGDVVQFLSYEGTFEAVGGPADGMTSTAVGASETGSTPVGASLQLSGTGLAYAEFTWTATDEDTRGALNTGQTISAPPPPVPVCETADEDVTPIHAIQGDGSSSPISGAEVRTRGVVIADYTSGGASGIPSNQGLRGFFVEAAAADRDGDPATSEGLFVFDAGATFDGDVGDVVYVAGFAGEFGGVTQVSATELDVCPEAEVDPTLPAPPFLPLPEHPDDRGDTYEPMESMRVTAAGALTVTEFFQLERFGEVRLSAAGVLQTPTNVHAPDSPERAALAHFNEAATILLDDGRSGQNLDRLGTGVDPLPYVAAGETLRLGDQVHDLTAVLHFGFGAWRLQPLDIDAITAELAANRTRPRPEAPPEVGGSLTVASFNVLNYFNGDGQGGGFPTARGAVNQEELERQTEKLVDAMTRIDADIYGLIEIENDGGEHQAAQTLVDALNAAHGKNVYDFVDTGTIGTDAIKQAFVYKIRSVTPVGEFATLTSDVDERFDDTRNRPALAQTFIEKGKRARVTVVVNHLKSKGSGCGEGDDDDVQGNCNGTRTAAAAALANWAADDPTGQKSNGTLIIGDLNAYAQEDPIQTLVAAGFDDQLAGADDDAPYTYTFDGQQGALDTALAEESLAAYVTGVAPWHINADEVPAIDYRGWEDGVSFNQRFRTQAVHAAYYDPSAFRSSDHDPVLVGLRLPRPGRPGRF